MSSIETLTEDVYHILDHELHHDSSDGLVERISKNIASELVKVTDARTKPREKGKLWASDLGKPCMKQQWYKFNLPAEEGEKLEGHTKFKFLYGNLLEEALLYLVEEAGHKVEDQQARVEVEVGGVKVSGKIDANIDDVTVDAKSTSSYGFKKYKDGIKEEDDSFGYLYQLGFYQHFGGFGNERCGFVFVDKQNGHIKYVDSTRDIPSREELIQRIEEIDEAINGEEDDASRYYVPKPYGKSGNMALPISCSYCPYKERCWSHSNGGKGLRTFLYSNGPTFFTEVAREPNCPEVK